MLLDGGTSSPGLRLLALAPQVSGSCQPKDNSSAFTVLHLDYPGYPIIKAGMLTEAWIVHFGNFVHEQRLGLAFLQPSVLGFQPLEALGVLHVHSTKLAVSGS